MAVHWKTETMIDLTSFSIFSSDQREKLKAKIHSLITEKETNLICKEQIKPAVWAGTKSTTIGFLEKVGMQQNIKHFYALNKCLTGFSLNNSGLGEIAEGSVTNLSLPHTTTVPKVSWKKRMASFRHNIKPCLSKVV